LVPFVSIRRLIFSAAEFAAKQFLTVWQVTKAALRAIGFVSMIADWQMETAIIVSDTKKKARERLAVNYLSTAMY
jgi:hypothetical protein